MSKSHFILLLVTYRNTGWLKGSFFSFKIAQINHILLVLSHVVAAFLHHKNKRCRSLWFCCNKTSPCSLQLCCWWEFNGKHSQFKWNALLEEQSTALILLLKLVPVRFEIPQRDVRKVVVYFKSGVDPVRFPPVSFSAGTTWHKVSYNYLLSFFLSLF